MADRVADWQDLADHAVEPNVFYEPWMLLPALSAFGAAAELRFVFVHCQPKGPPRKELRPLLVGLFPLRRVAPTLRMPVTILRPWLDDYCFLGAPLVRTGYERATLDGFFDWFAAHRESAGLFDLRLFPGDGPLHQHVLDVLSARGWLTMVRARWTRAFLRPQHRDADSYLRASLSGKRRKEFRRQRRRLAEHGPVDVVELTAEQSADTLIDVFVDLEASGWKGQARTAFREKPADLRFLRQVTDQAHRRGRLMATALRVNGRPVAAKLNLLAKGGAFAFKIAFDEQFARYSPGVLLELDNIERVCADDSIRWMDSCAESGHPMIDHLWTERRTVENLLISSGRRRSDLAMAALPLAKVARRVLTTWLPSRLPSWLTDWKGR